ncbi:hypothetical protein Rhopal_000128-T1 [Rhodotorula paludigena]|uniref:Major facilitator superfamily (MFS) profile domain-containing protein n=1 Tax=Rhodotorula paludigena TaxID=86838 RepID=A0AAV5GA14_9BASI|nr:hypothetical protein Rhopal_000128-T1 [Rhodotorula paludigena]
MTDAPLSPTSTLHGSPTPSGNKSADGADMAEKGHVSPYDGEGTEASPLIVKYLENDKTNPQNWSPRTKWLITANAGVSTLCIAFGSSVYSGGLRDLVAYFKEDTVVITLGLSIYVLGFALGPLLWAPFSEQWGRRPVFICTYFLFALFALPCALAKNIETLLICRFLAGFFGSSPLTNSGGVIADLFSAQDRALAMSLFALAPFAGPVLGPIVGGFVGENVSWRWLFWILMIFAFVMWILGCMTPETYAPVLLRKRAAQLTKETGMVHRSMYDLHPMFSAPFAVKMKAALLRPFVLLFKEVIVLLFAIYAAFIYGVLYGFFGAFAIVYQQERGWSPGIGGLAFIPIGIGMVGAVLTNVYDNKRYVKKLIANGGSLPPEARLPLCCVGGAVLPVSLFWFAWATLPQVHWSCSLVASAFFGFGMVACFLSMMNYHIDAYLILAASALAANAVLRSLFGFAFPLFVRDMFEGMGTQWALTLFAFVALLLAPVPFLFYRYGAYIRRNSSFAPGHKPAAPAPAPAKAGEALERPLTREEEEAADVQQLDLAQVESRREERERERRDGTLNEEKAAEAEKRGE